MHIGLPFNGGLFFIQRNSTFGEVLSYLTLNINLLFLSVTLLNYLFFNHIPTTKKSSIFIKLVYIEKPIIF
ncbi:hypothetical protein ATW78_03785 [Oenococcus oeni]|nr:hypothetical protein ATW78_03785 [Oenococcus oeni]OIL54062.1 hypothetical protein ATX18_03620 [Oenococcus oeni]SYW05487.1 hypothetical protein OENI_130013 [Oenococcus oeni]